MTTGFEDDCTAAVTNLSAALIDLYDNMKADPMRPQEAARQFGINKTLTWNIARLLQSDHPLDAAIHVPGTSSMERMLTAIKKHGGDREKVDRVRNAVLSFDKTIEMHVGDRSDLELLLDSMGNRRADGLELSRKLSFKGNSGVFGVQARTRLSSVFIAPNTDDPAMLDDVIVSGYTSLRRLRSSVRWPVFKVASWGQSDKPIDPTGWQPLDGSDKRQDSVGILSEFTEGQDIHLTRRDSLTGTEYILEPGPVGNAGAINCYRGQREIAFAPRYRRSATDIGEFGVAVTTPCQHLVFDLFIHQDLPFIEQVHAVVFAKIFSQGDTMLDKQDQAALPITLEPTRIAGSPPAVATALVPRYAELFDYVGKQSGWDLSCFRGIRLLVKYPPLGSTVMLRFPLEDPPAL